MKIKISKKEWNGLGKKAQEEKLSDQGADLFIKGLSSRVKVDLFKENDNYKIYSFDKSTNLDKDTLRYLSTASMPIYLGELDGKMSLFVFKG